MFNFRVYFLVLGLINLIKCELSLKIIKNTGEYFMPVTAVVEENVGANFSLYCDLVSSKTNIDYFDSQLSWVKPSNDLRFWKETDLTSLDNKKSKKIYSILSPSEVNKAVKHFYPLKLEDNGHYYCVSLKYNLYKSVEIVVRSNVQHFDDRPLRETFYCSERMFQCLTNRVCIIHHYVCDGKSDCKDGSDESYETCNGDPCKDKLQCDDGRCIPINWCCDRHHDPNCTVTNRPKCCQILSESYEELEYGITAVHPTNNGAKYLFISVCILCMLIFIILLILVLSKVVTIAKKTSLQQTRDTNSAINIETIALHQQSIRDCIYNTYPIISNNSNSINNNTTIINQRLTNQIIINGCDENVSDPLLLQLNDEQPPSYIDVVRSEQCQLNLNEPPPPYTSREMLNVFVGDEERH